MAESAEGIFGKTREVATVVVDRGESVIDNCATLNNVCTSNALRKTESQGDDDTTSSYLIVSASNTIAKNLEKEAVASLSGLGEGGGGRRPLSVEVDEDGNHHPFLTDFSAGSRQNNIGSASLSASTISTSSSFSSVSGLNNSTLTATTTTLSSEEECNNSLASHSVPQSSGLVSNSTLSSVHNQPQQRTHQQQKLDKAKLSTDRINTSNTQQSFQNTFDTGLVHGGVDCGGNSEIRYSNDSGCVDNNNPKSVLTTNQSR